MANCEHQIISIISNKLATYPNTLNQRYCTNTSSCTISSANASQQCYSTTSSVSKDTSMQIATLYEGSPVFSPTLGSSTDKTVGQTTQGCVSETWTDGCTWNDGGCHFVCSQQQMVGFYGYKRYRCNFHTQPRYERYDRTVCMQDLSIYTPRKSIYSSSVEVGPSWENCADFELLNRSQYDRFPMHWKFWSL